MKKRLLFAAALFAATATFAQDGLTSKKGEAFLPEAGEWAIGFDAAPWLNYAGNMMGNVGNAAPTAAWQTGDMSIMAKMFKDENTAYRMRLRLGFGSTKTENLIDTSSTTTNVTITDERKASYNAITIGGGIEKRRGNTRIQGFYGGELLIQLSGSKEEYTYGDAFNDDHTAQWTDWNAGSNTVSNGPRLVSSEQGSTFGITARGFVGVEIFVWPKVSIAGEYGWGLRMSSTGEGTDTFEEWNTPTGGSSNSLITTTSITGKSSSFGIDTDNSGGQLNIMFHF